MTPLNHAKQDAFGQKMLSVMNSAGLALMTSLGHRTGLFDTMADLPASTSDQIAARSGLSERYVREWLGAMVTGGVVEYDAAAKTYRLPPEHAAWLTREASPNNMAGSLQWVAVLGYVEDQVLEAFRHGKGVPYSAYHRFHEVMAEESAQTVVAGLSQHILPLVPELEARLKAGIDVLDVGCGSGRALIYLARQFPASRFVGYDFSDEGIAAATREAKAQRRAQCPLRSRRRGGHAGHGGVRPDHGLRRHPRSGEAGRGAAEHPPRLEARRHLPDAGHLRFQRRRRGRATSGGNVPVHDLVACTACRSRWPMAVLAWAPCGARRWPCGCSATPALTTCASRRCRTT